MCFLFGVNKGNIPRKTECSGDNGSSPLKENIIYNGRNYTPLTNAKNLLSSRTKADTGTKASYPSGNGNGCIVFVSVSCFISDY